MNQKCFTILVVDDDLDIVNTISDYLESEGYAVLKAFNGEEALDLLDDRTPHLILLDLMMPGIDGFEVCRQIRTKSSVPILIVSAKDSDIDKIVGLEIGADDYLPKPFNPREMLARVRAILRRSYPSSMFRKDDQNLIIGELRINADRREVHIRDQFLNLKTREFDLLYFLAENSGRVFSRVQLLDRVWGEDRFVGERTVDVHIRRLREQIEGDPSDPKYIKTVWGFGYKFDQS